MRYLFYPAFLFSVAAFSLSAEGDDAESTPKPDNEKAVTALERFGARLQENDEGNVTAFRFNKPPTAEAIELLKGLPALEGVGLQDSGTGGADLTFLRELPNLKSLWLDKDQLIEEGVTNLSGLPSLERLFLKGEGINDATLVLLEELPNLTSLHLLGTRVTQDGLRYNRMLTRRQKGFVEFGIA